MGDTYIRTREDMVREFRGEKRRRQETPTKGHFQLRPCVAALLFLFFFAAGELGFSYQGLDQKAVINEISENEDISLWQGRLVEVFRKME
ncbi:MAG: hypothetical protein ACOCNL_09740 [Acetivibrio ethanolgignens]